MTKKRSLLRLRQLKFVSLVDQPANEHSYLIVKRADKPDEVTATCRIIKIDESLGVLIGFANASTVGGAGYEDLQGDVTNEDELVKVCLEYAESGAPVDEMHDEQPVDGAKTVFLFPLTQELAKSLGLGEVEKTGILFGVKVPPSVIERARKGEINGFSIGGFGERESLDPALPTAKAELEKQAARAKAHLDEMERLAKANIEWLDEIAKRDGLAVARTTAGWNKEQQWAQKWLDANPEPAPEPEPAESFDSIVKRYEDEVAKATKALRTAVEKYQQANSIPRYEVAFAKATASDLEVRRLYEAVSEAAERLQEGPPPDLSISKAAREEAATVRAEVARQVDTFARAHNLEPYRAQARLSQISPTFKALETRQIELESAIGTEHDIAVERARVQYMELREKRYQAAKDEDARRKREALQKRMTPAERKLEERVQKIASQRGERYELAYLWALEHDDAAIDLYELMVEEGVH